MTWSGLLDKQPIATKMLTNSIQKNRIAHAYLFHGPRGTGKREASLLFAMRYFCSNPQENEEPCGACVDCKRIQSGNHPDVHWIQPDGQSIKKDQIEFLQKEFTYSGFESDQKIYILEEADKMTVNAANRLLKFLEEPSRKTLAILLTEQVDAMLDTILSRCQRIHFYPLAHDAYLQQLKENGLTETNARLGTALRLNLEEAEALQTNEWFANGRKIVVQLMDRIIQPNEEAYIFLHQSWFNHFEDRTQHEKGLDLLLVWLKDLVYLHLGEKEHLVFIDQLNRLEQQHAYMPLKAVKAAIYEVLQTKRKLSMNVHPTLAMEQLILKLER